MTKLTKRAKAIAEKVEAGKVYSADEAFALLSELSTTKFTESVDVAVNLGVDPRKSDQNVRSSTVLPKGTGQTIRVAVFAQGENAEKAKAAGADIVGFDCLHGEFWVVICATPLWRKTPRSISSTTVDWSDLLVFRVLKRSHQ